MSEPPPHPSTIDLVGEVVTKASNVLTAELALVRLEMTRQVIAISVAIASIVFAAVFLVLALIFLLQGLVEFLVRLGWAASTASFAVGGGIGIVALVTVFIALRRLSAARLMPERTIRQAEKTTKMIRTKAL